MKFTSILLLALPAVSLAQESSTTTLQTTTTSSAPSTPTHDPAVCEKKAGSYSRYCPRCSHLCASSAYYEDCLYSVFMTINMVDSQCQQRGGRDCANRAVDSICGTA